MTFSGFTRPYIYLSASLVLGKREQQNFLTDDQERYSVLLLFKKWAFSVPQSVIQRYLASKKWAFFKAKRRYQRAFRMKRCGRKRKLIDPRILTNVSQAFHVLQWVNDQHEASLRELRAIARKIARKEIPVRGLAEALNMGTGRLHQQFQQFGIPLVTSPGRLPV
jgi:hypothetical protein